MAQAQQAAAAMVRLSGGVHLSGAGPVQVARQRRRKIQYTVDGAEVGYRHGTTGRPHLQQQLIVAANRVRDGVRPPVDEHLVV